MRPAILLSALLATAIAAAQAPPDWVQRSRSAAAALGSALTPALRQALAQGGPVQAVDVCKLRAPGIAAEISTHELKIGRTALRVRNPANAPDPWERKTLKQFEAQLADGADPATLEAWTTVETDGRLRGRWMKAISTAPLCTTCHGETIEPGLAETIKRLYPEDQATGFRVGDLRGAFTATVELAGHDQSRSDSGKAWIR